jgi:hypothetical protein
MMHEILSQCSLYLQELAELEEIFWIREIKIVEIMHDWCYRSQEDKLHPAFRSHQQSRP